MKKGGKDILSQGNRCFPSKAISKWLQMDDRHLELINGVSEKDTIALDLNLIDLTSQNQMLQD